MGTPELPENFCSCSVYVNFHICFLLLYFRLQALFGILNIKFTRQKHKRLCLFIQRKTLNVTNIPSLLWACFKQLSLALYSENMTFILKNPEVMVDTTFQFSTYEQIKDFLKGKVFKGIKILSILFVTNLKKSELFSHCQHSSNNANIFVYNDNTMCSPYLLKKGHSVLTFCFLVW